VAKGSIGEGGARESNVVSVENTVLAGETVKEGGGLATVVAGGDEALGGESGEEGGGSMAVLARA
jgi:hypothetical protein